MCWPKAQPGTCYKATGNFSPSRSAPSRQRHHILSWFQWNLTVPSSAFRHKFSDSYILLSCLYCSSSSSQYATMNVCVSSFARASRSLMLYSATSLIFPFLLLKASWGINLVKVTDLGTGDLAAPFWLHSMSLHIRGKSLKSPNICFVLLKVKAWFIFSLTVNQLDHVQKCI